MTYFELYDIPVNLFPDAKALKMKYYELSKKYHPDINQGLDTEAIENTLEMSGRINTAYKTLTDFDQLLKYILDLFEVVMDPNEALSPEFLMEMMDLNETMMEVAADDEKKVELLSNLTDRERTLADKARESWTRIDADTPNADLLHELKEVYHQRKYLLRIRKNLNSFAGANL